MHRHLLGAVLEYGFNEYWNKQLSCTFRAQNFNYWTFLSFRSLKSQVSPTHSCLRINIQIDFTHLHADFFLENMLGTKSRNVLMIQIIQDSSPEQKYLLWLMQRNLEGNCYPISHCTLNFHNCLNIISLIMLEHSVGQTINCFKTIWPKYCTLP